ncbi:MAG: flagellar M-ring protein FliF [Sphingomonadaceae bacterium]|nr:flagellar M-ring protein FliF [Sphingomonadaceae bacterium]
MSDLVPASESAPAGALSSGTAAPGLPLLAQLKTFTAQEPVRRMLPWFIGMAALGGVALTWSALAPSAQRTLYSQLDDSERAGIVEALESASIGYSINNQTGSLSVDDGDFYRARMLVASEGSLATPQSGAQLLDSLPIGASRTMELERLRAAREHDLMLSIMEIDGVESVRVHLAEGEKSVFIRDTSPPSASVMVRLARGRELTDRQVTAIVNLVAGSVPGLSIDSVRVVDQHGQLLSSRNGKHQSADNDRLELQSRLEQKLRVQLTQLLTPMLGEGNFSSEIQVELDMNQVTSARESYDKEGVVRTETQQESTSRGRAQASGVPGVLSNTPPAAATAEDRPPAGADTAPQVEAPTNGESSSSRTYELGREVSVANSAPGEIKRLSVAVAISKGASKGVKPADIEQLKQLIGAAVGVNAKRGDQVTVVARSFKPVVDEPVAFYETAWFATVVRNSVALLAVLLVLLLGVRPLIKALKRSAGTNEANTGGTGDENDSVAGSASRALPSAINQAMLSERVSAAQRLATEQPDSVAVALREMLNKPDAEPA